MSPAINAAPPQLGGELAESDTTPNAPERSARVFEQSTRFSVARGGEDGGAGAVVVGAVLAGAAVVAVVAVVASLVVGAGAVVVGAVPAGAAVVAVVAVVAALVVV